MAVDHRLTQLRALVDRIERLPASPRRDWMLQEARSRMVDVETGDEPRPMRTLHEESPAPPPEPAGRRARNGRAVKRPSSEPAPIAAQPSPPLLPEPAPTRIAAEFQGLSYGGDDELLSLGDPPDESGAGTPGIAPWKRGLRG